MGAAITRGAVASAEADARAAFLDRHPWPEALRAGGGAPVEWLWRFEVAARAEAIWRHLTDSSRLNRALGLGRMELSEEGGLLRGVGVNGGFRQEWVEEPWTWVAGRGFALVRRYSRGFARVVRVIVEVEGREATSEVRVYFGWIPRGVFGRVMLRLGEGSMRGAYARVLAALAREGEADRPAIFQLAPPALAASGRARLAAARAELARRELPAAAIERLMAHLEGADELDLARLQVLALARRWGLDPGELLRVFLHATRLGILRLSWDVVCPHCRGVREEVDLLAKVPAGGRCDACEIEFGTGDPSSIEITFHVHPAVRSVQKQFYCSAEPAAKAHIKVQQRVAAGATVTVAPLLGPGRYRLRIRGQRAVRRVDVDPGATTRELTWRTGDEGDPPPLGPGPTLRLCNDGAEAAIFVVEEGRWSDDALRPAHLLGNHEFRDLFSEHFLGAGVQLAVGEQVILFTDMVGSTRFYSERGDAEAFAQVRAHFAELSEVYAACGGVLIKTIGDATMAAFAEPVAALRAAAAIQRRFPAGRVDSAIRLRISVHRGPCIAVNLNSTIDFFGGTVNAAAKLQACAEAGQIAMSPAIVEAPGVRALLAEEGARLVEVPFRSVAFAGAIAVTRWDVG